MVALTKIPVSEIPSVKLVNKLPDKPIVMPKKTQNRIDKSGSQLVMTPVSVRLGSNDESDGSKSVNSSKSFSKEIFDVTSSLSPSLITPTAVKPSRNSPLNKAVR